MTHTLTAKPVLACFAYSLSIPVDVQRYDCFHVVAARICPG